MFCDLVDLTGMLRHITDQDVKDIGVAIAA